MKILQKTIDTLKSRGINIRWYPQATFEEFKQAEWEKEYKRWFEYSKSTCKELNPPVDDRYHCYNFETLKEYEAYVTSFCDRIIDRHCDPYEYNTLYIQYGENRMIVKKENVKSKEITVEYVEKLVQKDQKLYSGAYGEFTIAMQRLCNERGLTNRICVYPTTYGIGVFVLFNFNADKHIAEVKSIMEEYGIEYYNEYSEHQWVYRFKISKDKENLQRLKISV